MFVKAVLVTSRSALALAIIVFATATTGQAATSTDPEVDHAGYRVVHSLQASEGSHPLGALVEVGKTRLYGTASEGGAHGLGTIFKLTKTNGAFSIEQSFDGDNFRGGGGHPLGGLTHDYKLYTTTSDTPSYIYRIEPRDRHGRIAHKLGPRAIGYAPTGSMILGVHGGLFGTTQFGGKYGGGTVFVGGGLGPASVVHAFVGAPDGSKPVGSLVQTADGTLYGTTQSGGGNGLGTIFSIDAENHFITLHSFSTTECSQAVGGLVVIDGDLYGVCASGGKYGAGAVFKFAADGTFTRLHDFGGYPHAGAAPMAGLAAGPIPGVLFGTTSAGGRYGGGTVFRVSLTGDIFVLHSFCGCNGDGSNPAAPLLVTPEGRIYGTTAHGGAFDDSGTIFELHASASVVGREASEQHGRAVGPA